MKNRPSIGRTFLAETRFGKMRSAHRAIFAQAPWPLRNPVAGPSFRRATPDAPGRLISAKPTVKRVSQGVVF